MQSLPPPDPIYDDAGPGYLASAFPASFTYRDVAKMCRVTVQTVYTWVKSGRIPSPNYIGYTARFTPEAVWSILHYNAPAGTYPVTQSPRSLIGERGPVAKREKAQVEKDQRAKDQREKVQHENSKRKGTTKRRVRK